MENQRPTDKWRFLASGIALVFICFLCSSGVGRAQSKGARPSGAGSFPLSFTHAAAWFGHRAEQGRKELTVLVYLQGTAGWHHQNIDFKWNVNQSPATIDMTVGSTPVRLKYWAESDEVEIYDKRYSRSASNVFLISGIDGASPRVTEFGVRDLAFKSDDNPPTVLLKRDAEVWAAVTGRPAAEHGTRKKRDAPEDVAAWDAEGLRLLLTEQPDQEAKGCDLFRRAAAAGYAPAQYRLGYCYESGRGVEQNFTTANDWYHKAAAQGFVDAQYKLAHSYRTGRGTAIDLPLALQWYKRASEQGDRDALHNIGWMYATGQGVKEDQAEAYRWFLQAAQHGEVSAQLEVARRLKDGIGALRDPTLAYSWLLVLAARRAEFVPEDWQQIEADTKGVVAQLDAEGLEKAKEHSRTWMANIAKHDMDAYAAQ